MRVTQKIEDDLMNFDNSKSQNNLYSSERDILNNQALKRNSSHNAELNNFRNSIRYNHPNRKLSVGPIQLSNQLPASFLTPVRGNINRAVKPETDIINAFSSNESIKNNTETGNVQNNTSKNNLNACNNRHSIASSAIDTNLLYQTPSKSLLQIQKTQCGISV